MPLSSVYHKVKSRMSSTTTPAPSKGSASSSSARSHPRPTSDAPVYANFASEKITTGAGVAIFHLASERVVVCWHSRDRYWFLPKGRRNASEETGRGAEREGFEEVSLIFFHTALM